MSSDDLPTERDIAVAGLRVEILQDSNLVLIRLYSPDPDQRAWASDCLASAGWDERDLLDVLAAIDEQRDEI